MNQDMALQIVRMVQLDPILTREWAIHRFVELKLAENEEAAQSLYAALEGAVLSTVDHDMPPAHNGPLWASYELWRTIWETFRATPLRVWHEGADLLRETPAVVLVADPGLIGAQAMVASLLHRAGKRVRTVYSLPEEMDRLQLDHQETPVWLLTQITPSIRRTMNRTKPGLILGYDLANRTKRVARNVLIPVEPHVVNGLYTGMSMVVTVTNLVTMGEEETLWDDSGRNETTPDEAS